MCKRLKNKQTKKPGACAILGTFLFVFKHAFRNVSATQGLNWIYQTNPNL